MLEKNNINKILGIFFDSPTKEFHMRELSRKAGISTPTVLIVIEYLKRRNLVAVHRKGNLKIAKASGSVDFIRSKRVANIQKIYESGFIDYINNLYEKPQAIVLFGSFSRGDDIEASDADIAVFTHQHKSPDTEPFERMLHRKISIHEIDSKKISREFHNNLTNGIVMEGAL